MSYHLVVTGDGKYALRKTGDEEPVFISDSYNESVEKGIELGLKNKEKLYIHNKNGKIEIRTNLLDIYERVFESK